MELPATSSKKTHRILGISIYSIGFLFGLLFNVLAVWSDLEGMDFWGIDEGTSFNSAQPIDVKLHSLKCPLLLSSGETGTVTISVSNPLGTPVDFILQADISDPDEATGIRRDRLKLQLGPDESRKLSWTVFPEDRKYGRLILVRVYLYQRLTDGPARTTHCGILVNDQPNLSSLGIIAFLVAACLLGMLVGGWVWAGANRPLNDRNHTRALGRVFLSGTILVGMIANLSGEWLFAGLLLVLALLTLFAMFEDWLLPR